MKIAAKDLTHGLKIPAPAHERRWLKTPLTVLSVTDGRVDVKGLWLRVRCSYQSPYSPYRMSEGIFQYRPGTLIPVIPE